MVVSFCLRLAAGLLLMLPLLNPAPIPPRFFRVHFLTALGLLAVTVYFLLDVATVGFWILYVCVALLCVVGSIVWHLDEAPGGRWLNWLTPIAMTACMIFASFLPRGDMPSPPTERANGIRIADDAASALILGSATTAMLMGHSYLISPAMSMSPLMRLLAALAASLVLRIALACVGLWWWTSSQGTSTLETESLLWLSLRWLLGLIAPLVLAWMAWETARIRSTQSATGILYVVVIFCFLGELTSQLLLEKTGFIL